MKKQLVALASLCLMSLSVIAQTKTAPAVPSSIVAAIEGITSKRFVADTTYGALTTQDDSLLAKEPRANWSLLQESGNMSYSNLVIGTRSYQLLITKSPKDVHATATLLRYTTPKSKPEPIARGTLQPKAEDKSK
ncbi:hypothetical protein [Spirosoma fluviale]|uniref:Uncharacterized protein n=1 Tax=Spirosoma fluviale TaxID=1597977 RepID=A0A286GL66_9BACT|nr:hypothetical protein [Spirosoma fluviale]SOD96283.1 hypothetical protein SAMN06269250_5231 [Spirosoma fluviale]